MKKNTNVETAQGSQATNNIKVVKSNVKTLENKKAIAEKRKNDYINFRVNSLIKRAKRMNIPEEEINKLVEKLKAQINTPTNYHILIMYTKNMHNMVKEIILNNKLKYSTFTDQACWLDGNSEVLKKLRELLPEGCKIHPYTKKCEPVLCVAKNHTKKKPTNNTKGAKKKAKLKRKSINLTKFKSRKKRIKLKTKKRFKINQQVKKNTSVKKAA